MLKLRDNDKSGSLRDLEQSLGELETLIDEVPNYVLAHSKAGMTCYSLAKRHDELGDQETAIEFLEQGVGHLQTAIEIEPTYSQPMLLLPMTFGLYGDVLMSQGKYAEALEKFRRSGDSAHGPNIDPTPVKIAHALAYLGRIEEASSAVEEITPNANDETKLMLSLVLGVCCQKVKEAELSEEDKTQLFDRYASKAIALLEESKIPSASASSIQSNPDFDAIRQLPGFVAIFERSPKSGTQPDCQ